MVSFMIVEYYKDNVFAILRPLHLMSNMELILHVHVLIIVNSD